MAQNCPAPIDVLDLQFKLHCRLKVFDNKDTLTFPKQCQLTSTASRYGLLFIGTNSATLQVVQLKSLENYSPSNKEISDYPRRTLNLPAPAQHICVNCDSTVLAVVLHSNIVLFYDILSFLKANIILIKDHNLNSSATEINWNPTIPGVFTVCKTDGSLGVYELKGSILQTNELPAQANASCFCWSPRGKQIAVGSKDGRITQYKPDLKAVKVINVPSLPSQHCLINLQWVSNFQFIGIYQSSEGQASLIVVDAPKVGNTVYTNYEDICYSGAVRCPQFYSILEQQWNLLLVASANGTEVGVLGGEGNVWTQWILSDAARAELPLSAEHHDTLPVGFAIDTSSTKAIPWGETTIPPAPVLILLSHQGLLCLFDVINLKENVPNICSAAEAVQDVSGLGQFIGPIKKADENAEKCVPKVPILPKSSHFGSETVITPISKPTVIKMTTPAPSKPPIVTELTPIPVAPSVSTAETDAKLAQLIRDDCINLESEMKAILHQGRCLKINLGGDKEKAEIVQGIHSLEEFLKEVTDISLGQNGEVHNLKQNLIQAFAWYEEARQNFLVSKDETMMMLLRAQPLDSASEKHLRNIQHSMYYLESQLTQASKALDEQWDNFQDYAHRSNKVKVPTMETIFQTMVRQNGILQKQSYVLKDIASRIHSKSRTTLLVGIDATKDIEDELERLKLDPPSLCEVLYEKILNRRKLTASKMEKLRGLLKSRKVTSVKSQLSQSVLQNSPASKSRHLISILGAQMSPVCKPAAVVKTLDFQSTPKKESGSSFVPVAPSSSVPIPSIPNSFSAFVPTTIVEAGSVIFKPSPATTTKPFAVKPISSSSGLITSTPKPAFSFGGGSLFIGSKDVGIVTPKPLGGNGVVTPPFSFATNKNEDKVQSPSIAATTGSTSFFGTSTPFFQTSVFTTTPGSTVTAPSIVSTLVAKSTCQSTPSIVVPPSTTITTKFPVIGNSSPKTPIVPPSVTITPTGGGGRKIGEVKQPPLFGATTTNVVTTAPSIFTISNSNIFGSSTASPKPQAAFYTAATTIISPIGTTVPPTNIFATSTLAPTISVPSSKDQVTIATSSSTAATVPPITSTLFGAKVPASVTVPPFGKSITITPSQATTASVFAPALVQTTTNAPFGTATIFPSSTSSGFASTTPTTTSPFGTTAKQAVVTTTNAPPSSFGQSFGAVAPPLQKVTTVFGQGQATFGAPNTFAPASSFGQSTGGSIFSTPTTTGASIFGTPTTTSFGAAKPFGSVEATPAFGAASTFSFATTVAPPTTSTSSFGFGGLNVANSVPFAQQQPANVNPFGKTAAKPFEAATNTSIFGDGGFGAPPRQAFQSAGSIFGAPAQTQQSAFGQQSGFTAAPTSSFGSGPFSAGATVNQGGFGSPAAFQKQSGFGAAPVFGSAVATVAGTAGFGSPASFGGAPAFGAAPAFGSPNKVFGVASPTGTFGATANQQSPSFGNLANQNTVGFGNLAQQQTSQSNSQPFSGNASFSSWR